VSCPAVQPRNATSSTGAMKRGSGHRSMTLVEAVRNTQPQPRCAGRTGVVFVCTSAVHKSRQGFPRRPMSLRLRRGLPRRAVLERSPSLLATGRTAYIFTRRSMRCPMSGPAIPDARDAVTGNDAHQVSVAVLNVNCATDGLCALTCPRRAVARRASVPQGIDDLRTTAPRHHGPCPSD
jgi:hypothetical protein